MWKGDEKGKGGKGRRNSKVWEKETKYERVGKGKGIGNDENRIRNRKGGKGRLIRKGWK